MAKKEQSEEKKKVYGILDLPGVGPATADKMIEAGFETIEKVGGSSIGDMMSLTGMSKLACKKLIEEAQEKCDMGFKDLSEYQEIHRKNIFHLTTGSKAFDNILEGGLESGAITECYGAFGSSKSQIAHQLCVNITQPPYNGVAVYIDTEYSFRPERVEQIARARGLDVDQVKKNIKAAKAYNSDHQIILATKVEELITKHKLPVKLVIVDSLMAGFRGEYIGRGMLSDRQGKISGHMQQLAKLADTYNLVVYVTNQVSTDPGMMFGDPIKPIGGNIVGHTSKYRIYLRKTKKGRIAELIDAPHLADQTCVFDISEAGVVDIK